MDVLVISACSETKQHDAVLNCADVDKTSREELIEEYPGVTEPAADLYEGDEHEYVQSAICSLEGMVDVDWLIISAGFGVVSAETLIPSYECTFSDDESNGARARRMGYTPEELTNNDTLKMVAKEKGIPSDLEQWLSNGYDVVFVILGESYLIAIEEALSSIPAGTEAFAFAAKGNRQLIGGCEWVPATEQERSYFNTLWTELRGRQFKEFVENIDSRVVLQQLDADSVHERSLNRL